MKIGYARVSTKDQKFDLQIDALKKAGCEKIYREVISGAKEDRPILKEMFDHLRSGDTIVIWKLDRLGRSLKHLIETVNWLSSQNISLQSLNDPVDTTTPHGKLSFSLFGALAEFERDIISERTKAGLLSARARGRVGGRPKGLSKKSEALACAAQTLYLERKMSIKEISDHLNISKTTLYAYLRHRNVPIG